MIYLAIKHQDTCRESIKYVVLIHIHNKNDWYYIQQQYQSMIRIVLYFWLIGCVWLLFVIRVVLLVGVLLL